MNKCIYCNKRLGTADTNSVCSECANERKGTHITTQPIILSRVDFSEKPPTADEVIEALSEYYKFKVYYCDKTFFLTSGFTNVKFCIYEESGRIFINESYGFPPHLITLIGRFYEGLEVKE